MIVNLGWLGSLTLRIPGFIRFFEELHRIRPPTARFGIPEAQAFGFDVFVDKS